MFDILFKGECQPQQEVEAVKQNMASLFKISAEKAEALFNGQSLTLKRGLEKDVASQYIQAISKAGAIAYAVESAADSVIPEPAAVGQGSADTEQESGHIQADSPPEPAQTDEHSSVLEAELAPPGTTLLEHEVIQPPNIDTTQMSLSQPGETLVEATRIPDADIETDYLSLSESGSDLADK